MRYREDTPGELARARAAVAAWRDRNPAGTGEELLAAIGHQFQHDYGVVLRAVLFAVDGTGRARSPVFCRGATAVTEGSGMSRTRCGLPVRSRTRYCGSRSSGSRTRR